MKKLVIFFTTAVLISSCSNNAEKNNGTEPQNTVTDSKEQEQEIERAKKEMLDSVNLSTIRQRTIDSMNAVMASQEHTQHAAPHHAAHHAAPVVTPATPGAPVTPASPANPQTSAPSSNPPVASTPTVAPKKKGLNNAVKGSLIGLGTGAAAGAIIDKDHRGQGAILGGVIGAVGGAVGGAVIDKNKKKKAKQDSIDAVNGVAPKAVIN